MGMRRALSSQDAEHYRESLDNSSLAQSKDLTHETCCCDDDDSDNDGDGDNDIVKSWTRSMEAGASRQSPGPQGPV